MNARDVFARRPACVGLWVVADAAILQRTAEALLGENPEIEGQGDGIQYAVFSEQSQRQGMTYVECVGAVGTHSPEERCAWRPRPCNETPGVVWWA